MFDHKSSYKFKCFDHKNSHSYDEAPQNFIDRATKIHIMSHKNLYIA